MAQSLEEAIQTYNGGIIFVSYLIAVIGAMTTLELLQRRTHIRGYYNWFLLFAAACSMGGVGIWSMHFIGNNSLTITLGNGDQHQLSYAAGFTFASLIVAILTMFLAFIFVGITEEAKVARIIPSGVIAGFGIVSMHYLGQVAIDFFIMKNKIAFVIAACVIAVCAVTAALFIFFKLREQWANQWYKRLGCAMLMGVAVCGMHYTALVGTIYYPGDSNSGPPTPVLGTPALIGIISAIVVAGCIILLAIVAKAKMDNSKLPFLRKSHKRLVLDTVFFDTNGRILVKVDGIVPMKQILDRIPEDENGQPFSVNHPLFARLFETTIQWSKGNTDYTSAAIYNETQLASMASFSAVNTLFVDAANELVQELRFGTLSDLGYLFDSILYTNTISKKGIFSHHEPRSVVRRKSAAASWLLSNRSTKSAASKPAKTQGTSSTFTNETTNATVIDVFNNSFDEEQSAGSNLTIRDSDSEDRHIFLVKKIESNKDLVNLLSIGFRFADPIHISKTMGEKLRVPSEYMLSYFHDMQQMAETVPAMYTPIKLSSYSIYSTPTFRRQMEQKNQETRPGVFVGLFVLLEDETNPTQAPYFIVDKKKRSTIPMTQLIMEGNSESEKKLSTMTRQQKNIVLSLSSQSLTNIASMDATCNSRLSEAADDIDEYCHEILSPQQSIGSAKTLVDASSPASPLSAKDPLNAATQFTTALVTAAKSLINISSYGKPLATSAKLYGDVIDVPAFSLRAGPCQLIVFRAYIKTPGTRFAINQTLTETIKCVPFPMYQSFAYYTTEVALEKYRLEQSKHKKPASYLTQQRLYQSTAARNKDLLETTDNEQLDTHEASQEDGLPSSLVPYSSNSKPESLSVESQQQAFSSLSPPPRVKRSKFTFPTNINSLDISQIRKDLLPNMLKGNSSIPLGNVNHSKSSTKEEEEEVFLNILPIQARFWWLNNLYDETHSTL